MISWNRCLAASKLLNVSGFENSCIKLIQLSILTVSIHTSTVLADQTAEELPALFTQLRNEIDSDSSMAIQSQIWQHWLDAPDANSAALLSQVNSAMNAGRLNIALRLSNQLVDSAPNFAEGWNKRATIHYLMRNNADSVADIRETVRLEPRHFGAISGLGMIFLREKNYPAALQAFEQVLEISPASNNAKRSIEHVRREMGREI